MDTMPTNFKKEKQLEVIACDQKTRLGWLYLSSMGENTERISNYGKDIYTSKGFRGGFCNDLEADRRTRSLLCNKMYSRETPYQ